MRDAVNRRERAILASGFVQFLDKWHLTEELVDCQACSIAEPLQRSGYSRPFKCCSFQPYWSAFLTGYWLTESGVWPSSLENWNFLPVGLVPPAEKRKRQHQQDMAARASDPELKCDFYRVEEGGCSIFSARPLECRRYYCASPCGRRDDYRSMVYDWAASQQAQWLYEFCRQYGYEDEDWHTWESYLEADGYSQVVHKPFSSQHEAEEFYRLAYRWLEEKWSNIALPQFPMLREFYGKYQTAPSEIG